MGEGKFTERQKRFILEYPIDLNAKQAAIRAGYAKGSAEVTGSQLLSNPKVKEAIDATLARREEKTEVDAAWLLKRLADESIANIRDLYDEEGNIKPIHEWPDVWCQGLIAGIETEAVKTKDGKAIGKVTKLKISDRIKRLELLGKHVNIKAFSEKLELDGKLELEGIEVAFVKGEKDTPKS